MKFEYFYSSSFLFIFIWLVNGLVNHVALHTIFISSTFLWVYYIVRIYYLMLRSSSPS